MSEAEGRRFHTDRPSDRTPEEREEHFQYWLSSDGENYVAVVLGNGDTPWHEGDIDARRDKWMQRYIQPDPPPLLPPIKSLRDLNRRANPTEQTWSHAA